MRITTNHNSNSRSPQFKAKLKIKGCVEGLSKKMISKLENAAQKVGSTKDIIVIERRYPEANNSTWLEMGHRLFASDYRRDNYVISKINNKESIRYFETNANSNEKDEIKDFITESLNILKQIR